MASNTVTKEQIYDSEVQPLMLKIVEICRKYSIPMLSIFQYSDLNICASLIEPVDRDNLIFDKKGHISYETMAFIKKLLEKNRIT